MLHVVNPADWARQGMAAGTPFALAHTFGQTGPFRPANTVRGIDNVVLAGSSTVPGCGRADRVALRAAGRRPDHRASRCAAAESGGGQTMISSELDAAGVDDPALRERLPAVSHAQRRARPDVLPGHQVACARQRPAVHALYGFARRADDILDDFDRR